MKNKETILFARKTEHKINGVNYVVNSFFDEGGEELKCKIKKLLKREIEGSQTNTNMV